jgi:hypothetical protein
MIAQTRTGFPKFKLLRKNRLDIFSLFLNNTVGHINRRPTRFKQRVRVWKGRYNRVARDRLLKPRIGPRRLRIFLKSISSYSKLNLNSFLVKSSVVSMHNSLSKSKLHDLFSKNYLFAKMVSPILRGGEFRDLSLITPLTIPIRVSLANTRVLSQKSTSLHSVNVIFGSAFSKFNKLFKKKKTMLGALDRLQLKFEQNVVKNHTKGSSQAHKRAKSKLKVFIRIKNVASRKLKALRISFSNFKKWFSSQRIFNSEYEKTIKNIYTYPLLPFKTSLVTNFAKSIYLQRYSSFLSQFLKFSIGSRSGYNERRPRIDNYDRLVRKYDLKSFLINSFRSLILSRDKYLKKELRWVINGIRRRRLVIHGYNSSAQVFSFTRKLYKLGVSRRVRVNQQIDKRRKIINKVNHFRKCLLLRRKNIAQYIKRFEKMIKKKEIDTKNNSKGDVKNVRLNDAVQQSVMAKERKILGFNLLPHPLTMSQIRGHFDQKLSRGGEFTDFRERSIGVNLDFTSTIKNQYPYILKDYYHWGYLKFLPHSAFIPLDYFKFFSIEHFEKRFNRKFVKNRLISRVMKAIPLTLHTSSLINQT